MFSMGQNQNVQSTNDSNSPQTERNMSSVRHYDAEAIISSLPTFRYSSDKRLSDVNINLDIEICTPQRELSQERNLDLTLLESACSICLSEYNERDLLSVLPCNHIFHSHCLLPWFKHNIRCPLCNYLLQSLRPTLQQLYPDQEEPDGQEDNTFGTVYDRIEMAHQRGDLPASSVVTSAHPAEAVQLNYENNSSHLVHPVGEMQRVDVNEIRLDVEVNDNGGRGSGHTSPVDHVV